MDLRDQNRSLIHSGKLLRQPESGLEFSGWSELFVLLFDNYSQSESFLHKLRSDISHITLCSGHDKAKGKRQCDPIQCQQKSWCFLPVFVYPC
jgi:hypothetical protein